MSMTKEESFQALREALFARLDETRFPFAKEEEKTDAKAQTKVETKTEEEAQNPKKPLEDTEFYGGFVAYEKAPGEVFVKIPAKTIEASHIKDRNIGPRHLCFDAVEGEHLTEKSVDYMHICGNAVRAEQIAPQSITAFHFSQKLIRFINDMIVEKSALPSQSVKMDHLAQDIFDYIESRITRSVLRERSVDVEHLHQGLVKYIEDRIRKQIASSDLISPNWKEDTIEGEHIVPESIVKGHLHPSLWDDIGKVAEAHVQARKMPTWEDFRGEALNSMRRIARDELNGFKVGRRHISEHVVGYDEIEAESIGSGHLRTKSVREDHIQNGTIMPKHIHGDTLKYLIQHMGPVPAPKTIGSQMLKDNCVDPRHISGSTIMPGHLNPETMRYLHKTFVQKGKGSETSVEKRKVQIESASIREHHLRDDAVTTTKLATGAVNQGHINRHAIHPEHIFPSSIGAIHLSERSVGAKHLKIGCIKSGHIPAEVIEPCHFSEETWAKIDLHVAEEIESRKAKEASEPALTPDYDRNRVQKDLVREVVWEMLQERQEAEAAQSAQLPPDSRVGRSSFMELVYERPVVIPKETEHKSILPDDLNQKLAKIEKALGKDGDLRQPAPIELGFDSIDQNHLKKDSVLSRHIMPQAVTPEHLNTNVVDFFDQRYCEDLQKFANATRNLEHQQVHLVHLNDSLIEEFDDRYAPKSENTVVVLPPDSITGELLREKAVGPEHIHSFAIRDIHIKSGQIKYEHLHGSLIETVLKILEDHFVQKGDDVAMSRIVTGIVDDISFGKELLKGAVKADHLGDRQVWAKHIGDYAIQSRHLSSQAVSADHIEERSIDSYHIKKETVGFDHLSSKLQDELRSLKRGQIFLSVFMPVCFLALFLVFLFLR